MELTQNEIDALREAPWSVADGGETSSANWRLEQRGLVRPVYSYNRAHYVQEGGGYDFSSPVYVYTLTELGAVLLETYFGREEKEGAW